jgi:arylsulfatase A-like enzyme
MLCRTAFYIYNSQILGPIGRDELGSLLRGALTFDTVSVMYAYGAFVLLSLLPVRAREKRWWGRMLFCYFAVATLAVAAVNFGDVVYFHYTQKRFTSEEFMFLDNDNSGGLLLKFMGENRLVVLIAVALYVAALCGYRPQARPQSNLRGWLFYPANALILIAAIPLAIGGVRGGFSRTTRPITLSSATQYTSSLTKSNLILSTPFCLLRTMGKGSISYVKYFDPEELNQIYTPYHLPCVSSSVGASGPLSGLSSGPLSSGYPLHDLGRRNIVISILESFSAEHSALLSPDLYPDGRGFTPFLDSLMREGYYFPSAYANGRKSIEAMPSVFASIPSFKTPFILTPQSMGRGEALPAILDSLGYATSFFCGSPRGSMGFGAYANAIGVRELYSQEDYEAACGRGDFDGYWGVWDEPFLGYMGRTLDSAPQPFYASAFTLSSHHPFVVPDKYRDVLPVGRTKMHKCVAYTDMALRRFFEQSAGQPWFRNTIFVFTADHVSSETFAPETAKPLGNSHITLFFYTPDGALRGRDEHVMQQINIMPTLLGLIGYRKPYFAFGRDIFNEPERTPVAINYREERFQCITDSLTIYFDEHKAPGVYRRGDKLLEHNLVGEGSAGFSHVGMEPALRLLRATVQQYYTHLEQRSYVVPDSVGCRQ